MLLRAVCKEGGLDGGMVGTGRRHGRRDAGVVGHGRTEGNEVRGVSKVVRLEASLAGCAEGRPRLDGMLWCASHVCVC